MIFLRNYFDWKLINWIDFLVDFTLGKVPEGSFTEILAGCPIGMVQKYFKFVADEIVVQVYCIIARRK